MWPLPRKSLGIVREGAVWLKANVTQKPKIVVKIIWLADLPEPRSFTGLAKLNLERAGTAWAVECLRLASSFGINT